MAVEARRDSVGLVRYGPVLHGLIRYGKAVEVRYVKDWNGGLSSGMVRQLRLGELW